MSKKDLALCWNVSTLTRYKQSIQHSGCLREAELTCSRRVHEAELPQRHHKAQDGSATPK